LLGARAASCALGFLTANIEDLPHGRSVSATGTAVAKQRRMQKLSVLVFFSLSALGCASGGSDAGDAAGGPARDGMVSHTPDAGASSDGDSSNSCQAGATRPCYPGNPSQAGVGICRAGVQHCEGQGEFGQWQFCQNAITPQAEACGDGLDNDCDGEVDNGCPCTYMRTTGFTASGGMVCCEAGGTLASVSDCGSGSNHWAQAAGNCGVAFEGRDNYGGPCANIVCQGTLQMGVCR